MNQPAIRDLAVTRLPGSAALAEIWHATAKVGRLPRVEVVILTVDSQRFKTDPGGWAGVLAQ
ncbi:MAG TPA: hypothetical protein VGH04_10130 [Gemmatimonadaceae bacterium]|jgi:hypothetical protein